MTTSPDEFDQLTGVFDTRIAPSPAFAERLRQRLHEETENTQEPTRQPAQALRVSGTTPQATPTTVQGSPNSSQRRARRSLRPAWFGSLETAAAAILVFALAFGTIYGLQREQSTRDHGSEIVASPIANQVSNSGINWGGDAGHSWAFDMPSFTGYVTIRQSGESSSFANVQSVISNGTTIVTQHPPSSPTQGAMLEALSPNETPRWKLDLAVMPGMAIDGTHLYAIHTLDSEDKLGSGNRKLVAISLETGKVSWTGPDIGTTGKTSFSWAPVVSNGVVFVADAKGSAYALKASDGSSIWESKVPDDAVPDRADGSSVTQTGGVIALNGDGLFVAGWVNSIRKLDPQTGKEFGTIVLPDSTSQYDLQLRGNTLVARGVSDTPESYASSIVAIDTSTGKFRWSYEYPTRYDGNAILLDDRVVLPARSSADAPIQMDTIDLQTG
ncbi:MAG: PQQ-binding-like beta-propeller repeat protein, partial [Thermomicrobiales bacterium]